MKYNHLLLLIYFIVVLPYIGAASKKWYFLVVGAVGEGPDRNF